MENLSIALYLAKEHKKLEDDIKGILMQSKPKEKREKFLIFKNKLEKHIFTEEQIISYFTNSSAKKTREAINNISLEHKKIIDMLEKTNSDEGSRDKNGLQSFFSFLKNHLKKEVKDLYPVFDRSLDNSQKKFIIKKLGG